MSTSMTGQVCLAQEQNAPADGCPFHSRWYIGYPEGFSVSIAAIALVRHFRISGTLTTRRTHQNRQ